MKLSGTWVAWTAAWSFLCSGSGAENWAVLVGQRGSQRG